MITQTTGPLERLLVELPNLSDERLGALMRESMLDWLSSNHDKYIGELIRSSILSLFPSEPGNQIQGQVHSYTSE